MVQRRLGRLALEAARTPGDTGGNRCKEVGVRVREIMSSPVVTVPPGMPLKEVAKVLVTRGIIAVPVVETTSATTRAASERFLSTIIK